MQQLLRLKTGQFQLIIWCKDVSQRQQTHQATLEKRIAANVHAQPPLLEPTMIRFTPPLLASEVVLAGQELITAEASIDHLALDDLLFFENMQYQFEWVFFESVDDARLMHRSHTLNESFAFSKASPPIPARLTGTINTGNDVGWMRLPLEFVVAGQVIRSQVAFEVLPTKMDLHSDLPAMYQTIDKSFPLWRFSLVEKTEQDAAKSQQRGDFPLLWLANFSSLREQLEKGLKVITQAPHSRLQPIISYTKAERLKSRLSNSLATKIKEDRANGLHDKRYRVEKKRLSVDTPENRFIKMVVTHSKKKLTEFEDKLRKANDALENQRLSDAFLTELSGWQQPLQKLLHQSFLKGVGAYAGLTSESLVLQQKTGYSSVYSVWQELKFYLDIFSQQSSVSMKSVAEIYEVWCFLQLRQILEHELGFVPKTTQKNSLQLNDFFEYKLKDGFAGAFEFERSDGMRAKLAHEPIFTKKGAHIRSYWATQKPDIILEITSPLPSTKRFIWLFDAKYRIRTENDRYSNDDVDTTDFVPEDAINQMHRYRDALIRITDDARSLALQKSRPVFGAFALYPGYFDQQATENPYAEAIHEIGIGAFALLPSSDGSTGHHWLSAFLKEQIGDNSQQKAVYGVNAHEEYLYVQEAARIPYEGMQQVLYPYLTMTAALGPATDRHYEYFAGFSNGSAQYYHMPEATFTSKFKEHVLPEIRFLALPVADETGMQMIFKVWPIKKIQRLPRHKISVEQAGKSNTSSNQIYILFELGKALSLTVPIKDVPNDSFRSTMKLTTLEFLQKESAFAQIEQVYQEAWA